MARPVIIGIAGGSGCGKSTVLARIVARVGSAKIAILPHDAYYKDLQHLSFEERAAVNVDHPDSLETTLLVQHLDALIAGNAIERPTYDFTTHTRLTECIRVKAQPVIVLDGILVLAEPALRARMDIKIYVDTDDDIRLLRRIRRDMKKRGRSIDSILDQYERTVRPMHIEYVEPSKRHADVIIPRGGHNQVAIDMVVARISEEMQR